MDSLDEVLICKGLRVYVFVLLTTNFKKTARIGNDNE